MKIKSTNISDTHEVCCNRVDGWSKFIACVHGRQTEEEILHDSIKEKRILFANSTTLSNFKGFF